MKPCHFHYTLYQTFYTPFITFNCHSTSITWNIAYDKSLHDEYILYDLMKSCYIPTKLGQRKTSITVLLICLTSHFVLSLVPINRCYYILACTICEKIWFIERLLTDRYHWQIESWNIKFVFANRWFVPV